MLIREGVKEEHKIYTCNLRYLGKSNCPGITYRGRQIIAWEAFYFQDFEDIYGGLHFHFLEDEFSGDKRGTTMFL
jgi:hypothetical protein